MGFSFRFIWPWSKADPTDCNEHSAEGLEGYYGPGPIYGVFGQVRVRGFYGDGYGGHVEGWEGENMARGGLPQPIGNSIFCIQRKKSMVNLVKLYDRKQKKYIVILPPEEERRIRLAVIASKNKWRWL